MKEIKVKVVKKDGAKLPIYATDGAVGADLYANIEKPIELHPLERKLIPTGIFIELPPGYEAQIRPRSGLAAKHGITLLNALGTIDWDYRGEIKVILINLSNETFTVEPGMRIAQMVIAPTVRAIFIEVDKLSDTHRGEGGFGHSGTH